MQKILKKVRPSKKNAEEKEQDGSAEEREGLRDLGVGITNMIHASRVANIFKVLHRPAQHIVSCGAWLTFARKKGRASRSDQNDVCTSNKAKDSKCKK